MKYRTYHDLTEKDYDQISLNMRRYGGAFATHIGIALKHANVREREALADTFTDLFNQYLYFKSEEVENPVR